MPETKNNNSLVSQSIAEIELTETAKFGWGEFSVFKLPFFIKSIIYMACYGCTAGLLQFLYKSNLISVQIKDLYTIFLYLWLLMGGLNVIGELNKKRVFLILINIVMFQTWQSLFYNNYKIYIFYLLLASWLIFWWVLKEPEIMAKFGMRKNKLLVDIIIACISSIILLVYVFIVIKSYGFTFKFELWKIASHLSGILPQNIITFNFIFAVWKQLQEKGISWVGNILVLALLINLLQAPSFFAFMISGVVNPALGIGGLLGNTLLFVLVLGLTFKTLQNSLASAFLLSSIMELLVMIGIL